MRILPISAFRRDGVACSITGEEKWYGGGGGSGGYSPCMANGGRGGDGIVIIRCRRIVKGLCVSVK